jgi:hypothetical protein
MITGKKTRYNSIAICALAAAFIAPSVIHGLTISNHLISHNVQILHNAGAALFQSSQRRTRNSLTVTYVKNGGIQSDEFTDINIDDVLLEAENALKLAQTSLVDGETDGKSWGSKSQIEFGDIDVATNNWDDNVGNLKDAIRDSLLSNDAEDKTSKKIDVTEVLSSTLGGILLGSLLGSVAAFKLTEVGVLILDSSDFLTNAIEFAIPIIAGVILGGTVGFAGSLQENTTGKVVRNVLGVPARAIALAIVTNVQEAARRQVEKATNDIKAIPSNVAKEVKLVVDVAIESAIEKLKKMILVLAIVSSVVAVGVLILNAQLVTEIPLQL